MRGLAIRILFTAGLTIAQPGLSLESVEPVGNRGDAASIRFEGVKSYTVDAVRRGLIMSGNYMVASHPRADFEKFKAVLIDALVRGYRNGGFPDVAVKLKEQEAAGWLTVVVEEGPRFRRGEVVIRGVDDELTIDLAGHITGANELKLDPQRSYLHRIKNFFQKATSTLAPEPAVDEQLAQNSTVAVYPGEGITTSSKIDLKATPVDEQILDYFGYPVEMPAARGRSTSKEENELEFVPSSRPDSELWKKGDPFPFPEIDNRKWLYTLRNALAEFGYRSARINLQFERNTEKGTVDLLANIDRLGPPAVIGTIRVEGAKINTAKETLDHFGLKTGLPLTKDLLAIAELKLIASGRYLAHRIVLQPRSAIDTEQPVDLLLQLTECPGAPALGEMPTARQKALLGFTDWFSHLPEGGDDLVMSWDPIKLDLEETVGLSKPIHLPGGRFILSPRNGLLLIFGDAANLGTAPDDGAAPSHIPSVFAMEFSNRSTAIFSTSESRNRRWVSPPYTGTIIFALSVQPSGELPGENPMSFNIGAITQANRKDGSEAPVVLNLFAPPAAALYTAIHDSDILSESEPGVLTLGERDRNQFLSIDAISGHLSEIVFEDEIVSLKILPDPGAFDRYRRRLDEITAGARNEYNPENAMRSLLTLVIDRVMDSELVIDQLDEDRRNLISALATTLIEEKVFDILEEPFAGWLKSSDGNNEGTFEVPFEIQDILSPNRMASNLAAMMLGPVNATFPDDSWMRQLTREFIYVLAGNRDHIESLVDELTTDPAPMGPLAYRIATGLLDRLRSPFADRMALKGYGKLTDDDFRLDWEPLLASNRPVSASLLRFMEVYAQVEAASNAPRSTAPRELRMVIDAHQRGEHETAHELLEPLASQFWHSGFSATLGKSYEERLGLAGIDHDAVAVVVNRDPITHLSVAQALCVHAVSLEGDENPRQRELRAIKLLIDRKLLYREFLRLGGQFPVGSIEAAMEKYLNQTGNGDRDLALQRLTQFGMAPNRLTMFIREMMAAKFMQQKASRPTALNLRDYYNGNLREFIAPPAIHLRMISLEKSGENRVLLEDLRERILGGSDFSELARIHSKDSKATSGGDWGWLGKGDLKEEITNRAFALKPGELSEVFEFLGHYRIIQIGEKREARQQSFEEIQEALAKRLAAEHGQKYTDAFLERLRRNAAVISIGTSAPWSAWGSGTQTRDLGGARRRAFEETVDAIEGKLVDGKARYRIRMRPQTDPNDVGKFALGMDQEAYDEHLRALNNQGLKMIHHQQFDDKDGNPLHQSVWTLTE